MAGMTAMARRKRVAAKITIKCLVLFT